MRWRGRAAVEPRSWWFGPEARGFVIGAPVAYALGGFVPIRKAGKLPAESIEVEL